MSTKIYNGRLLHGTIGEVYAYLLAVKPQALAIAKELQLKFLAKRAAAIVDEARLKGQIGKAPLLQARRELLDRKFKSDREQRRDPEIDFDFELWLFPRQDTTLAIVHTEQPTYCNWFDAQTLVVSEYAYWNNSDRPDEVTAEQWDQRRQDWDEVLPGAGVPSDRCLTFKLVSGSHLDTMAGAEVLTQQPSVESRVAKLARVRHVEEHYNRLVEETKRTNPEDELRVIEIYLDAERNAAKDPARRGQIELEIAPFIRALTAVDLTGAPSWVAAKLDSES